jgi:hypothetical protein
VQPRNAKLSVYPKSELAAAPLQPMPETAFAKPGGFSDHHRLAIRRKNKVIEEGDSSAASQVPLPDNSSTADLVPTARETSAGRVDASPSNQDNSTPMLDVHAPHESVHTWKDFLIHIATIVIGLLIAIALEQTVEFFHHRHEVAETRAALHEEMQNNIAFFHQNVEGHIMTMAYLHNNLRIFEYLRDHPGTPQDKIPGILYWPVFTQRPQKAAWSTAEHTDVLSLMPRAEVREITDRYAKLDYAWEAYQPVIASLTQCTTYFSQTPDISTLSPASVANEIEIIKQTMAREAVYGITLSAVGRQPGFGPVPTWWQMLPYWTMQDYYRWARQHPELNMPSQMDIDQARSFAGLPPETGNASFEEFTAPVPNSTPPKP